jgi:methyl-CpG-binding domain protein 4
VACGWNGEGTDQSGLSGVFEPEWKRVQPEDKELRAFLRWCWMREGVVWDADTGEKRAAGEEEMARATEGEVIEANNEEGKIKTVEMWNTGLEEVEK